jgi:hypothetical protein
MIYGKRSVVYRTPGGGLADKGKVVRDGKIMYEFAPTYRVQMDAVRDGDGIRDTLGVVYFLLENAELLQTVGLNIQVAEGAEAVRVTMGQYEDAVQALEG